MRPMDEWLARYAAALAHGLPERAPAVDLGDGGDTIVRGLADHVTDQADAETAALAVFLAGVYTALKTSAGDDARAALEEAVRVARRIAPSG